VGLNRIPDDSGSQGHLTKQGLCVTRHLFERTELPTGPPLRSQDEKSIDDHSVRRWASWITEFGVDVLIRGAIPEELSSPLAKLEIRTIPWIRGKVDHVLSAYLTGRLPEPRFVMPGSRLELRNT
jgi:hypothetical protein